jgi:cholesterol oxidase
VIPGYAHMDCFIGNNAHRDVFPVILGELDKHN